MIPGSPARARSIGYHFVTDPQARPPGALDLSVFIAELALLVVLSVAGARLGSNGLGVVLGVGLPLLAAVLWGLRLAPRATDRLSYPARLVAKLAMVLVAAALLAASGALAYAVSFFVISAALFTIGELRERKAPGA